VVGQAHILREAFAPTNNLLPSLPASVAAPPHRPPTSGATASPATTAAIHVLVISMDGGDVSREDRLRVRVSLADDSDEWGASERLGGVTSAATSRVGVVDEEAAVCSWNGPGQALDGDEPSNTAASGELLTLPWDPRLALSGWGRGRASVLKFEVSRGPGRPVEWTGFVPTAGLVHGPRCVFERAICLTGRLGSEPPTSARTVGSTGASAERRTVSLEVAMMFQPVFPAGIRGGSRAAGVVSRGVVHQEDARRQSFDHRPFHPDLRRIACEGGELVVHCLRARNLRLPRQEKSVESRDAQPEIFLTVLPDGGEVQTSTSFMGPGGRHPVWGQSLTLSIADAATARVVVRVRNVNQVLEDNVLGEVELSLAGLIAAEHGVAAAAALPGFSGRLERPPSGSSSRVSLDKEVASDRQELADNSYGFDSEDHVDTERFPGRKREPPGKNPVSPHKIKPCGVETWFPLFVAGRQGSREREVAGEVRLCCRFLSTDFMMQREVTAGADEGDNGPVGALRYALERRPGRLFMTIRCCRALPKAMIGERAPLIEARLRHGGWQCSTRRKTGLNPVFNENMAVDVLWTPQDFNSPEVVLEVKDKALGGGLLAAVRVAVAPFILHPTMPADIWIPLLGGAGRETNSGIYIGLIYVPSVDEIRNVDEHLSTKNPTSFSINSIEHIADPEYSAVLRRARRGVVHVQIMSARGLPASSKDPQVGVRLRVGDHCGGPLPPFQRTAAIRGGRGEPQFNSTFFLDLQQDAPGLEEESKRAVLGRTPMLEVEARCCRGKGKVLGTVEIPIFPLWFMGHMTRAWYPMRSCDGEAEAGRVFIGLQFIADGKSGENGGMTAASVSDDAGTISRRRRYLFLEVRQGRDLRHTHAESDRPVVHVEMLGSGARGKTPPARGGGPDPEWADGAGLLALPYPLRSSGGGFGSSNEVLRITVLNEQRRRGDGQEKGTGRSIEGGVWGGGESSTIIGQCDWPLSTEDLDLGHPISSWHAVWTEGIPAGAVYVRCRVGFEGDTIDRAPPYDIQNANGAGSMTMSPLSFGNYHVEFLEVRGFERTLQRIGIAAEGSFSKHSNQLQWEGAAHLAEAPGHGLDGNTTYGASSTRVGSGRAVAVGARGRGSSRSLCVQVSVVGERLSKEGAIQGTGKTLNAVSYVPPAKLVPIADVPGSELLQWFPCVGVKEDATGVKPGSGEEDTGQVLLSIRYAPLAVGILEVAIREAQLQDNDRSSTFGSGNIKALTRLLPAQTGAAMGHKVRSTPGRRGVRTSLLGEDGGDAYAKGGTIFSWDDTCPHRMRFNNAFNKQPTTLHVSVVQGDRVVGFASVAVEAVVHDGISTMARETAQSTRKPRGSARDVGPVGLREEDFGHSVQAWYPLHAPDGKTTSAGESEFSSSVSGTADTEVGRVLVDIKFAPHPNVLVRNWQEGAATLRANGIAAMKAIFYRLNRSGNLVIETEDLRLALVDAVDEYLATSTAAAKAAVSGTCKPFAGTSRASQAGEFLLLMSEGSKSSFGEGSSAALSESAADSILSMMDRDRTAEVTFAEFCMFLSRAASQQADAAVGDLVNELAEDNEDEGCDSDSDDDALGSDASRNAGANCDEPHGRRRTRRVPSLIGLVERSTDQTVRNTQLTGRQDKATTTENGRLSSPKAFSDSFQYPESARKPNMDPPELFTAEPPGRVQDKLSKASRAQDSVDVSRGPNRPAAPAPHHTTEGNETVKYVLPEDITSWTVGQVLNWLSEDMQLPQYLHKFRDASIDGLVLCDLTDVLLEEGLGISDSLHRLKILRHMQKLSKKQQQQQQQQKHHKADTTREDRQQTSPPPRAYAARKSLGVMTGSSDTKEAQAGSPANRSRQTGCTAVGVDREEDPLPLATGTLAEKKTNSTPIPPSPPGEKAGAKRGTGQGVQQTEDTHKDERFSAGSRSGFSPDEEAFALTMKEVRGEFVTEEVGGEGSPESRTGVSQLKNRKRHICIPANATMSEVHEVVQTAMWATAALLEDTNTGQGERVESTGDYPEAWWGSSEGGSTAKSGSIDGADFDYASIGGGSAEKNRENGGNKRARLLFNELCSFQQGGAKSSGTARGLKLTRHRLEVGIRSLLKIEMRWEQWQLFLDSLPRLRTQGFLNPGDFFEAFGFHPLLRRPTTPRSALGGSKQRKFEGEPFDFEPGRSFDKGSLVSSEATSGWETSATQDISNFREFVLGIADALRTCRATLGGVISTFDKRGTGKVSVSEFMSLVKALTRKRRYSARARAMTGGFDRKQAYLLLRCVDEDGDRSVVLRDLVAFVFATWTEELERLTGGNSEPEEVRQRRRQLQKACAWIPRSDLRRHFPANFRRALGLDAVEPDTGHQGPFAALLARVGLEFPSPPSPRSQPTFVSPRRAHRQRRSETARSSSSCHGADVKFERESVVQKERGERWQGGRKVRAMSVSTPARRSRGDRPATSDGQRRLGFTANKELHRCTSFEAERVLSLPPRVDLSAMTLTASHNRELLAQGTFQTSGVREGTFS
ncbi:unnamed protein product, partial [Ectocarpus sp. 6 AP-2014]